MSGKVSSKHIMEFRRIFDTIPEKFDRWRPRYCFEAFEYIINYARLNPDKSILEIGPGTGQATEPLLKTGSKYLAIELGENLAAYTAEKFKGYENFRIVNDDFETHDFGSEKFDLVFSAATIQWIPENIAFSKSYNLLKNGGALVMMLLYGDYKTPNEALFNEIQKVYNEYFRPEIPYAQKLTYGNAVNYGFTEFLLTEFHGKREYNADDYVEYLGTHSDHIVLRDSCKDKFYDGIKSAILNAGDRIVFDDTYIVYTAVKL